MLQSSPCGRSQPTLHLNGFQLALHLLITPTFWSITHTAICVYTLYVIMTSLSSWVSMAEIFPVSGLRRHWHWGWVHLGGACAGARADAKEVELDGEEMAAVLDGAQVPEKDSEAEVCVSIPIPFPVGVVPVRVCHTMLIY